MKKQKALEKLESVAKFYDLPGLWRAIEDLEVQIAADKEREEFIQAVVRRASVVTEGVNQGPEGESGIIPEPRHRDNAGD